MGGIYLLCNVIIDVEESVCRVCMAGKFTVTKSDRLCCVTQKNSAVFYELWLAKGVVYIYIYIYIYICVCVCVSVCGV